jgi:hypothetical protein
MSAEEEGAAQEVVVEEPQVESTGDGTTPAEDASATPPAASPAGDGTTPPGDGTTPPGIPSTPAGAASLLGKFSPSALFKKPAAGNPQADDAAKKAAAAKADKEMCESFRSTFERNQAKYSEAVFESLSRYFETPDTMEKLSIMLEKYIGMYIRSPKFGDRTEKVINEAFGDVIKRALKKNFKKGANLKGLYTELDKYMGRHATGQRTRRAAGGGTRSKRKQKRKTVKRRS